MKLVKNDQNIFARDDRVRARSALQAIDAGCERVEWVRVGMAARAAGLEFDDWHEWSATASNYKDEADCRAVWRSMNGSGVGAGTLFAKARAAGWRDTSARTSVAPTRSTLRSIPWHRSSTLAAFDVQEVWKAGELANDEHPYVAKKRGDPVGLRVYRGPLVIAGQALDGALMVPALGFDGALRTVQFIPPVGKKVNAPGHSMDGVFTVGQLAPPGEAQTVYVGEGIGVAWACRQATGSAAVVCFGAGRMEAVAREIRMRYAAARLVLVADAGKELHCARISKDVGALWVEMPAGSSSNYDANDYAADNGLEALAALLAAPKGPPQRFPLLTAEVLASQPPLEWRIKHILPEQGIAAVYGPSGSGKTFLLLNAAMSIADGLPWFDYRVRAAPVTYVGLEGAAGLAQRVRAYRSTCGRGAGSNVRFITAPLSVLEGEDVQELGAAILAAGAGNGVVIIDTLNASAPGADENSSADMGEIISSVKRLQADVGGLVILVHHTGKDSNKGMRGHSSLFAALDAAIEVTREGDRRAWRVAKSKDGEDGVSRPFSLAVVELGEDRDGETVTSCVVEPDVQRPKEVRRAAPPRRGNMGLTFDAISAALKDARSFGQASAPPGRPCIRFDEAVAVAAECLPCESKRQRERAQDAITSLVSRKNLAFDGGWIWLP
ncbi:AAA family ATPase [Aromatoleum toluclasticum]|uniref:AAA family ATPase n=1 Tax=Aromatoleum toluclasticum TaxID=92003 RepID=UPI00037043BA|nr:AAA family ATPase [Aromatoleum toluclasticum]